ncbi:hypothetical protein [Kutzneria sp. 744]|uniref:hypothetical protein n=1 Tax=Kutzneria sp. (strain 744) TaxID=345341 RepID=UPI0003EECC95|nr:hypothetical protein [Kutzneria sp. 744]EWM12023.1 serine/arginine repetitive matrix protein 1 [Kutzneria sp. 744]
MSSKTRTRTTATTDTTVSGSTLRSVPKQDTAGAGRTDAEDKLWEALHANPYSTAADLSGVAKIGKSTAAKILVKWAADGSVTRTAGIADGGRRAADLWAITDIDAAPVDDAPAEDIDSAGTAQTAPDSPDEATITPIENDDTPPVNAEPTDASGNEAEKTDPAQAEPIAPEEAEASDGDAETAADTAKGGKENDKDRLAPGALRGMVEDFLRDHPGKEFGPTAIAKDLGGKSSGAVSNALDKLAEDGVAVKTQDKPRRFALTPAETTAAPAPTN